MIEGNPAREELKRIDHLIHVTLKYTRTVDVIRSIIEKFLLALDKGIGHHYDLRYDAGKIKSIPTAPLMRLRQLEESYPKDPMVKDLFDFYMGLRQTYNAEYKAKEEYRKNVALVTKEKEVNIPMLREYQEKTKAFIEYLEQVTR